MLNPSPNSARETGFIDSMRTLAGSVLDLLHIRIELFAVEWQEEQQRGKHLLVLAIAGALLLMLGMLLLTFFIIVLFWDSYRLAATAIVTVLYLGSGMLCLWKVRAKLHNHPPPFASSLGEFIEDLKQLRAGDDAQPATDAVAITPAVVADHDPHIQGDAR
jgi:uncharacterized membrane protein YqjE